VSPDSRNTWLVPEHADEFATFLPIAQKKGKGAAGVAGESVFDLYSLGVSTNRDEWMYDFSRSGLAKKAERFIETYNSEVDRWKRRKDKKTKPDEFVRYDQGGIKWSEGLKLNLQRERYAEVSEAAIRHALYRPFCRRLLYYDAICNEKPRLFSSILPTSDSESQNVILVTSVIGWRAKTFSTLVANHIADLHLCAVLDGHQCFPLYTYTADGTERRDNVTDWALDQFRAHYHDPGVTKTDIFYYVYAILHHPDYRARFADDLKRELPRIPFAPDFSAFVEAGCKLARLHLEYEQIEPYPLEYVENPTQPLSFKVQDKMRLAKDRRSVIVNPSLTLHGVPEEALNYRLGNRSALDWVIDQYQVAEDTRSGIRSDPNLWSEDERYIVRLIGQVIRVSVETVATVCALPSWE
jgi:predicted helicase